MTARNLRGWIVAVALDAAWAPAAVFVGHVVAYLAFDAYRRWPPLDIPMHFLGGLVIAFFFDRAALLASRRGVLGPLDPTSRAALTFGMVGTATVSWEFAEWAYDRAFGTRHQVGLDDTMLDMLLGVLGGASYLAGRAGWRWRPRPRS